jgi:hypothetical protein
MIDRVYRINSTVGLPMERFETYLDDPALPRGLDGIEAVRQDGRLSVRSTGGERDAVRLEGTIVDGSAGEEDDDPTPRWDGGSTGSGPTSAERVAFRGDRGTLFRGDGDPSPMFRVLCDIAGLADRGELTAITRTGGTLEAIRIVDGESEPATVEIVEDEETPDEAETVDWQSNQFIGGS